MGCCTNLFREIKSLHALWNKAVLKKSKIFRENKTASVDCIKEKTATSASHPGKFLNEADVTAVRPGTT